MEGANAYGSTSSNNFGGTISTYYDKNEGKKVKDEDKKKEKEKEKEKEESDSDSDSESEDIKIKRENVKINKHDITMVNKENIHMILLVCIKIQLCKNQYLK